MLADMAINLELSRLVTYRSAADVDNKVIDFWPIPHCKVEIMKYRNPSSIQVRSSYFASIAKCFAADKANEAATNAVQVYDSFSYHSGYI